MNALAPVAVGSGEADERLTVGVVRIGCLKVALSIRHIREIVPRPDVLEPAPGASGLVIGSIILRGAIIPVVDLAAIMGSAAESSGTRAMVVIVRLDDELIGVLADSLEGVHAVSADAIRRISFSAGDPVGALLTGSFVLDDSVVYRLDPSQIASLPGLWTTREHVRDGAMEQGRSQFLTFRVGDHVFAVAASGIRAVLPRPAVLPPPCDLEGWEGFVTLRGRKVPLTNARFCLGIGDAVGRGEVGTALVLETKADGELALIIDQVCDLERFSTDALHAMPSLVSLYPELFLGVRPMSDGSHQFVIDPEALLTDDRICTLARACDVADRSRSESESGGGGAVQSSTMPHLLFELDQIYAVPLHQVSHITEFPASIRPLPGREPWLMGEFTHRELSRPVIDLGCLLGFTPVIPDRMARLLFVDQEGRSIALAVRGLHSVVQGQRQITGRPSDPAIPVAGQILPAAVMVPAGERPARHYTLLDISDLLDRYELF